MKLVIFLALASLAVMVVMVYQVVRQEMLKHSMKTLAQDKATELSRKENEITNLKILLQGMKPKLLSMTKLTEELKTKKETLEKDKKSLEDNITKCNKDKEESETRKTETTDNFNKKKGEHDQAKKNAQATIKDLKQNILNRDKAVCKLVDTTNPEARKLCGKK